MPTRFLARIAELLPHQELSAFIESCTRPLRKSIRVNTLKITVSEFQKLADELGWQLTPIPWCSTGFWIDRVSHKPPLGHSWLHAAGLFYIQEASSMLPPELLDIHPGQVVLDLAAAPGSKSTQLAALLGNTGLLVANEPITARIKKLAFNLDRCGVSCALTTRLDGTIFGTRLPNFFDRILLDAPCTGEGTMRKDPAIAMSWSEQGIQSMSALQRQLIISAFEALKPGGVLIYSTCTLAPEENEAVVDFLLRRYAQAELLPIADGNGVTDFQSQKYLPELAGTRRIWPQRINAEGFFVARIRKIATTPVGKTTAVRTRCPFRFAGRVAQQNFADFLKHRFSVKIDWPADLDLVLRDEELWLRHSMIEKLASKIRLERSGLQIARLPQGKNPKLTHAGAELLLSSATANVYSLSANQLDHWLAGQSLALANTANLTPGQILVSYHNHYLGLGLLQGETLKNQRPRELLI